MEDRHVREQVAAVERLLEQLEELPHEDARRSATEAVAALLSLYGEGLRRISEQTAKAPQVSEALASDELVSHLMLLHGLHSATLEERVAKALDEVRPYMGSHGGGVELLEIADGVARVRLEGTCSGCAASTVTLKLAIEEAVLEAAPELERVEAEGVEEEPMAPPPSGTPLPVVESAPSAPNGRTPVPEPAGSLPTLQVQHAGGDGSAAAAEARTVPTVPSEPPPDREEGWHLAGPREALTNGGGPLRREVGGAPLLFSTLGEELYAYHDRCPGCRSPFTEPSLVGDALRCDACGRRYDVRRAGQCLDGPLLQLDPVPLLVGEGDEVKVAVGGVVV